MGGMLFNMARHAAQPTLGRIFAENIIRAVGRAAGVAVVSGIVYAMRRKVKSRDSREDAGMFTGSDGARKSDSQSVERKTKK